METRNQIKIGAILSYLSIVINIITGLVYTPWMITMIGKDSYGLYALAMSIISLFVFDFGLSNAITRFISKYLAEGNQEKADNCLGLVYRLYIILDIVLLVILTLVYIFIPQIYKELTQSEILQFKIVFIIAASFSVVSFPFIPVNGVLSAHEKFIQLKTCDVIHRVLVVLANTICLCCGLGLYSLVAVYALAGLGMIGAKLYCISAYTSQKIAWRYGNISELKEISCYSGFATIIALAQRCIFSISPSILGMLSGSNEIALLGIAITIENFTYTIASSLNGMFLPKVSRILATDNSEILPLMVKVGRIQVFIIVLVVFGFALVGRDFICLWIGKTFLDCYWCSLFLIIPSVVHLPQLIGQDAIYAANKIKKLAIVYCIMAISNIVGAFIFAKSYGAIGICLCICIAYFVRTIGMDIILKRNLNIDIFQFFKKTFGKIFVPMVSLFLVFYFVFIMYMDEVTWISLGIKVISFSITYMVTVYLFLMNQEEKYYVDSFFRKLIRR